MVGATTDSTDNPSCSCPQSPRFEGLIRPYTAEQVVSKRGTIPLHYPSNVQGKKLHKLLSQHAKNKTPSHTYGAWVTVSTRPSALCLD